MNLVQLFLSAVSEEFRSYRDALRSRLQRPNVAVHVQEDFIATGTETLDKLDLYIKGCDAVIHVVGDCTGAPAHPQSLQALRQRYPDLADRLPFLKASLEGDGPPFSYTQWEAYLAVYHRKVLVIAAAAPDAPRDRQLPADAPSQTAQKAHRERLEQLGRYAEIRFTSKHELIAEILASTVLDLLKKQDHPKQVSNLPVRVPAHFIGREDMFTTIDKALAQQAGAVAIAALHGLRGVGKTAMAAAYAERHRGDCRATWWVRAQSEPTLRADLVALGVRLGWVAADDKEEPALAAVMERLLLEGDGILLIFDNAFEAKAITPYLPRGGTAKVLVTSTAHTWRRIARPVKISQWPKQIGADFLVARTGLTGERNAAMALSEALGGLPLAHEQAAAYCERLDVSLARYCTLFEAAPAILDDNRDVPEEFHGGLTMAKAFALAIEEAGKLHPAAEPLIAHAALLALEPIPLFVFSQAREKFGEPLASGLEGDGLDEAVAALRAFALVDRETVADERDPTTTTDSIRLHRLVRMAAQSRRSPEMKTQTQRTLLEVLAAVYPKDLYNDPNTWPRARRLDALALSLLGDHSTLEDIDEPWVISFLTQLAAYRFGVLGAHAQARPLFERALKASEKVHGHEHSSTAQCLNSLALLLRDMGDYAQALRLAERSLAMCEKLVPTEEADTATSLDTFGGLLHKQGDFAAARPVFERALAIRQKVLGLDHPDTGASLYSLAMLMLDQGDLDAARPLFERAIAIKEKAHGPMHRDVIPALSGLAHALKAGRDFTAARALCERALTVSEKVLGPEHPETANCVHNLAELLHELNDVAAARALYERALAIKEKAHGPVHSDLVPELTGLAGLLQAQGDRAEARVLFARALAICEKAVGPRHPDTATSLNNLANFLFEQGDAQAAQPLLRRALTIFTKVLGPKHPTTNRGRRHLARVFLALGDPAKAKTLAQAALAAHDRTLGPSHPWTRDSANVTADALARLGQSDAATALRARYGSTPEAS